MSSCIAFSTPPFPAWSLQRHSLADANDFRGYKKMGSLTAFHPPTPLLVVPALCKTGLLRDNTDACRKNNTGRRDW